MEDKTELISVKIQKSKTVLRSASGTGTLIFTSAIPEADSKDRFNDFYKKVSDSCKKWCEEELLPTISSSYPDTDRWECAYRLMCDVASGDITKVRLSITLTDRTRRKTLFKHEEEHFWSSELKALLPKRAKSKQKNKT